MGEVSSAVEAIRSQLTVLHGLCENLSHSELVELLSEVTSLAWSVPALEHRALNRLTTETEPARLGESSWKKVLSTALRVSDSDARRRLQQARNLGPRRAMTGEVLAPVWEATAAAQARGLIGPEHVVVIARFHQRLPGWVDVGTREAADAQLAELGTGLGPQHLDAAAGMLLMMIDQDGHEPSEADRARKRGITIGAQRRDGMSRLSGWLTPEARALLDAVLAKLAAPGMCDPDEVTVGVDAPPLPDHAGSDPRTQVQRNHDALTAMARTMMCSGQLGTHHGLPVTVIVSTTLQQLESGAGLAATGGGSTLPIREVIRLAAHAHHYLYIYDQHTQESLYLGRARRCASPAQRIVLHARDRGCTRPGCTAPGYQCQAHHAVADWKNGGHTNIDDLTLACGPDNRLIEKTGWSTTRRRGNTEWIPPPALDTGQQRTNNYHHPEKYLLADHHHEDQDRAEHNGEEP